MKKAYVEPVSEDGEYLDEFVVACPYCREEMNIEADASGEMECFACGKIFVVVPFI